VRRLADETRAGAAIQLLTGIVSTSGTMEHLINIANGLFILGYLVRDLLWLRALSLAGACCLALYFGLRPEPIMQVVYWNVFFALLNAVWIIRLACERFASRKTALEVAGTVRRA
jgi:hypothetical protein